jgi:8-oxo-dGTP pyrophosphatase MutT (NUDIX family)
MPEATVAAIITKDADGEEVILLTLRDHEPFNHLWCLPGGHIESREKVYDAIVREIKEETGLTFSGNFFSFFEEFIPDFSIEHVVLVFVGKGEGVLPSRTEEVSEFRWVAAKEALNLNLAFKHSIIIRKYIQKGECQNET